MLSTRLEDKYPDRFFPVEEGTLTWRRICVDQEVPLFFLRVQIFEESRWISQSYVVGSMTDLVDLCRAANDGGDVQIRQVAIFCPPWMSGSSNWALCDLEEISATPVTPQGPNIRLFKTTDGRQLVDSIAPGLVPELLADMRVIFRRSWFQVGG